jgi:GTP-binding protein
MFAHCVSLEQDLDEMVSVYKTIRNELKEFDPELLEKKEIILLTKSDISGIEDAKEKEKEFVKQLKLKTEVMVVSIYDLDNLKELQDSLVKMVRE